MNRILFALLIISISAGCVQFKPATLYTAEATEPAPEKPDDISMLVSTEIFSDDTLNVWGIHDEPGKEAHLEKDITKSGDAAIYIKWDRSKAEWTGFGAGWDDWAGKDLTGIREYAAFEFYVRTEKGKMFGLPMVMSLEDYSGVSCYAYVANKYFERFAIDEEWQKIVVPLTAFNLDEFGVDLTNIKQLQVELQGSGSLYLDEIQIIPYEPQPEVAWIQEEVLPEPTLLPRTLFDDGFVNNNGFGMMKYACQDIRMTTEQSHSGQEAIYAEWDASKADCRFIGFGVSWYKWRPFDITPIWEKAAVEFYLKTPKAESDKLSISIEMADYGFKSAKLEISKQYTETGSFTGEWQKVICPLADFKGNWDPKNAKQLNFVMTGTGKVWIDDIRLIGTN